MGGRVAICRVSLPSSVRIPCSGRVGRRGRLSDQIPHRVVRRADDGALDASITENEALARGHAAPTGAMSEEVVPSRSCRAGLSSENEVSVKTNSPPTANSQPSPSGIPVTCRPLQARFSWVAPSRRRQVAQLRCSRTHAVFTAGSGSSRFEVIRSGRIDRMSRVLRRSCLRAGLSLVR